MKSSSIQLPGSRTLTISQRRNRVALGIGFLMGLVTLFSVAFAVSRSANDFIRTADDVARINRIIGLLQQLDLTLTRAESENRGFLITGDPTFLATFSGVHEEVSRQFFVIRSLEFNDPEAVTMLNELEDLVDQRIEDFERIMVIRQYLGNNAAIKVVSRQRGLALMQKVREAKAHLEERERRTLRSDDLSNRRNRDDARWYLFTGLGFAMLTVTISMTIVLRDSYRRMEAEGRLAALLALQNAIFDSMAAAIFAFDSEGRISSFNRTAERLLGYFADEAIDKISPAAFHDPAEIDRFAREMMVSGDHLSTLTAEARRLERYERRWTLRHKDGHTIPAMVSYSVLRDENGNASGFVGVATDLTEIEAARRDLQAYIRQLEETQSILAEKNTELERTSEELKESRDVALAATRLKSEFLANMSHEIRTPMNGVLGMGHLLLQSNLTDRQRSFVTTMQQSAESLLSILNDILDLSKMEAGKMNFERFPFDLRDLMEDIVESLAPIAHRKELEVILDFPPTVPHEVIGDALRLRQVITNLFSNAIKFTEEGEVSLSVRGDFSLESECLFTFCVRDTGIGIEDEQLPHIFESFAQADGSTTRRFGGSGLGLSIVRQLTHLMGGEIDVTSHPGKGSEFSVTLPLPLQPNRQPTDPTHVVSSRILIVDDHATNRLVARELLESWGARVSEAVSGEDAIQRLEEDSTFDLVLMDMHMPGQDGVQTAHDIHARWSDVPMVLLSSLGYFSDVDRNLTLFKAVLSKPIRSRQLFDTINMVLLGPTELPEAGNGIPNLNLEGLRVLVVEDNPVNQLVAMEMLVAMGCTTDTAEDGMAAVAKVEAGERYDMIFMDVQMPRMDGLEATRTIRRIERMRSEHTPIIAMTANAMTGDRERCLEVGMDGYLAKPLQARDLLDRILEFVAIPPAEVMPPLLDHERLDSAVARKASLKLKVIGKYLDGSAKSLSEIQSAERENNFDSLYAAAHSLKGSSLTLGAPKIAEYCAIIEASARSGEVASEAIEGLTKDLPFLWRELETLAATLSEEA